MFTLTITSARDVSLLHLNVALCTVHMHTVFVAYGTCYIVYVFDALPHPQPSPSRTSLNEHVHAHVRIQ